MLEYSNYLNGMVHKVQGICRYRGDGCYYTAYYVKVIIKGRNTKFYIINTFLVDNTLY